MGPHVRLGVGLGDFGLEDSTCGLEDLASALAVSWSTPFVSPSSMADSLA
jgi:hypothetical protein